MRRARRAAEAAASGAPPGAQGSTDLSEIAGYRVVRRLAHGTRATVYLGHSAGGVAENTVALRVFHPDADTAATDREIAVLTALPDGIAPALHDIVTLSDGRLCLVLERDDGPTLGWLVGRGRTIRAGEAVTVLAPVVVALSRLHEAGWSHGALTASAVRFDPSGRARIGRWGSAVPLGAGAARTRLLRADYSALAALVNSVCTMVDPGSVDTHAVDALGRWMGERVDAHPFLAFGPELEHRLFTLARPLAVRLDAAGVPGGAVPGGAGGDVPWRLDDGGGDTDGAEVRPVARHGGARHALPGDDPDRPPTGRWRRLGLPDDLASVFAAALTPRHPPAGAGAGADEGAGGDGLPPHDKRVRRQRTGGAPSTLRSVVLARLWARRGLVLRAGCLTAALVVLAITLIPPKHAGTGAVAAAPPARPTHSDPAHKEPAHSEPAHKEREPGGAALPTTPQAEHGGEARAGNSRRGADPDPVRAAAALLERRAECYRVSSVVCLNDIAESGGPASDADAAAIRRSQHTGVVEMPAAFDPASITLVEQSGGAALLALQQSGVQRKPASLLMVRGEAGWRLREIFDY